MGPHLVRSTAKLSQIIEVFFVLISNKNYSFRHIFHFALVETAGTFSMLKACRITLYFPQLELTLVVCVYKIIEFLTGG